MILGTLGAILLVLALGMGASQLGSGNGRPTARRVLDERLAAGEVTASQHRELLTVLDEDRPHRETRWLPWALAAAGVTLLVVPGVAVARGADGWWANHWTVMSDHMGWGGSGTTTAASSVPGAEEIMVEAGDVWFRPDTIELAAGQTVNLTVNNTGRAFHDLTIPDLGLRIDVEAGDTTTTAVTVDTPGTYEFFCSVPGHEAGGMRGQLVVQ